jgi:TRAP-type C4-dicarboxylate transport system permease small subunit
MPIKSLESAITGLNTVLIVIAGVALAGLILIATADVVLQAAGSSLLGSQELVGLLGAVVVACALGQTQYRKDHVPVDLITRTFSKRVNHLLDVFKYSLKLVFAVLLTWYIGKYAWQLRESGELSETLKLPFYWVVLVVAAGFLVLAITVVLDIVRTLTGFFEAEEEG